jgi:hypothetical protein
VRLFSCHLIFSSRYLDTGGGRRTEAQSLFTR